MSDRRPLMPKATAVWLVEHTALSFDQIAEFCGLHPLEVKGIADGEVAQGIKGMDPVSNGQLTREEIARAEKDASRKLQLAESKVQLPPLPQTRKGPRYTPVSRRHDRPNAVLWLLRNHPELKDSQLMRLVGTTKPTIAQIRDRTHWNSAQLTPQDPVTLGLCSQTDLDAEVKKAARRAGARAQGKRQGSGQGRHSPIHSRDNGAGSGDGRDPGAQSRGRSSRRNARAGTGTRAGEAEGHDLEGQRQRGRRREQVKSLAMFSPIADFLPDK